MIYRMSVIANWTKNWAKREKKAFLYYKQTSSTNDKAKELSDSINGRKELLIAELQTKGRGRRNKEWLNSDMMLSWNYYLSQAPQLKTTVVMGLALHSALKKIWPANNYKIKIPNDIYIKNKKMAGILVEVINKGPKHHQLIIGVGMNVFCHPKTLDSRNSFTHLQEELRKRITEKNWADFLNEWSHQTKKRLPLCLKRRTSPIVNL